MSEHPIGFMSYVRFDDEHENGRLTEFCKRLSGEVRVQTGEKFHIFQDRNDIAWGEQWKHRLDESLDAVTFLIPIITPGFFKSPACRAELERFIDREKQLGRSDLILPVYYVNCPVLNNEKKRETDPLAKIIAGRQYADWRELRFEPFSSPQVGKTLAKMATQIFEALERAPQGAGEHHRKILVGNAPPAPLPFIGRQDDFKQIQQMVGLHGGEAHRIIGIHGVPGVGKSAFLAHFAWDERVRQAFPEGVLWAGLGQNGSERLMFSDWCRLAGIGTAGLLTQEMAARLGERLLGKRVLLMIDDVWREYGLGLVLRLLHPTVSLVFTSRIPAVAHGVTSSTYDLDVPSEDAAFSILQYFAPTVAAKHEDKCRGLSQSLGRLPLALNVAGRLLAARERLGYGLDELLESLRDGRDVLAANPPANMRPFIEETNENLTVAELIFRSVAFLPQQTRRCFFYLGVMAPKPATFDLALIRSVWHFLEDPLPELTKLVDMGLIEPMNNGRFQMHAMLVAYAKARLQEADSFESL